MELIDQHTKKIMEECKVRARDAGLKFDNETLEYIVTNRDLIDLSPKVMIPTLYDYWVNDVEVLKGRGIYKLYPSNPYETVINSRPAISYYNDNNPDWLNIMIFYHVLAHIDFFQNNILFQHTWDDDFVGQALADKRLLESLRSEHGRWVDYVIEFSRSIDNITGYYRKLNRFKDNKYLDPSSRVDFYFGEFLQNIVKMPNLQIYQEVEKFNDLFATNPQGAESIYFSEIKKRFPEFAAKYKKHTQDARQPPVDLMEYIRDNSPFLKKEENEWMKSVMDIVYNTALYFEPQMRSKICNEGWASYWHDTLFRNDDRISGHEVAYAMTNAAVTSINRVGLNPYAIGLRLIQYIEELADKGKLSYYYQKIHNIESRKQFDEERNEGRDSIYKLRTWFSDFMLINTFVDQDFLDMHDLFVVGQRINPQRQTKEYYVKSRKAEDYKQMLLASLPHPPVIQVDEEKSNAENLYLRHMFEGKQLYKDFIPDTMLGIEFLWGGQVQLETTEIVKKTPLKPNAKPTFEHRKVLYTMKDRKADKKNL